LPQGAWHLEIEVLLASWHDAFAGGDEVRLLRTADLELTRVIQS